MRTKRFSVPGPSSVKGVGSSGDEGSEEEDMVCVDNGRAACVMACRCRKRAEVRRAPEERDILMRCGICMDGSNTGIAEQVVRDGGGVGAKLRARDAAQY